MLNVNNVSIKYDQTTIIDGLSLAIPENKITALIGPNGCGKSTLLKALCRINPLSQGSIELGGKALADYPDAQLATKIALLPQILECPEGITVKQLVEFGRSPHISRWVGLKDEDHQHVAKAMQQTGVLEFAHRPVDSLSGGQRQRAWIAMVVAQNTDIVMLDEPTTYLDLSHQVELMNLMQELNRLGKTIIVVLHDLNQACRYSDHLVVLKSGELITQGKPAEIFNEKLLLEVFDLEAKIIKDPVPNSPMCVPV